MEVGYIDKAHLVIAIRNIVQCENSGNSLGG